MDVAHLARQTLIRLGPCGLRPPAGPLEAGPAEPGRSVADAFGNDIFIGRLVSTPGGPMLSIGRAIVFAD